MSGIAQPAAFPLPLRPIQYDLQLFRPPSRSVVSQSSWIGVATYSDKMSAQAILGLLTGEGLPAYLKSDEHVPGLGSNFSVFVPPDRVRQARGILERGQVSEKELTAMAMGELGSASGAADE